jgi:hypothetical protein
VSVCVCVREREKMKANKIRINSLHICSIQVLDMDLVDPRKLKIRKNSNCIMDAIKFAPKNINEKFGIEQGNQQVDLIEKVCAFVCHPLVSSVDFLCWLIL